MFEANAFPLRLRTFSRSVPYGSADGTLHSLILILVFIPASPGHASRRPQGPAQAASGQSQGRWIQWS
ncbi:unnamed protein product [Lampetra planeri]